MQSSQPQASFAFRAEPTKSHGRRLTQRPLAAIRDTPDDAELTRRLISLISLLGIYAVGLVVVAFVSDGPDIGVLLAALFGHALFVGGRYLVRENRERRTLVAAGTRGVVVFSRRARFIRYRDIAAATSTDAALTLRVRGSQSAAPLDVVLRWSDDNAERHVVLSRIDGRIRRATARQVAPAAPLARPAGRANVATVATRSRESLARVAAALGELADLTGPKSSTHIPLPG